MTPRVTVGVPFYNEERHLRAAVESILRQTFRDFEVLLVDDGSSDNSVGVAKSLTEDPRVRVIVDGRRRRLPARLNQIAREARGAVIARMDADDISHPARLARQLQLLERNECDVVGTWAALVDEQELPFAVVEVAPMEPLARSALTTGLLVHASMIGRRDWFVANPYDELLFRAEDRDLWCRTYARTRFGVIPEPLYVVRVASRSADFLYDYLESQRQNRRLFRRYGRHAVGPMAAVGAHLTSLVRSGVMSVAVQFGLADRVVRRRGREPTALERIRIDEAFNAGNHGFGSDDAAGLASDET